MQQRRRCSLIQNQLVPKSPYEKPKTRRFRRRELSWFTVLFFMFFPFPCLSACVGGIIHADRYMEGTTRIWVIVSMSVAAYIALRVVLISLIYMYKAFAPMSVRNQCLHTPSCSSYGVISIAKYGVIFGITLTALRIHRCRPPYGGQDYPSIRHLRRLFPGAKYPQGDDTT